MSLILAGLVLAGTSGAVIVGRWLAKRRASAAEELKNEEEKPGDAKSDDAKVSDPPPEQKQEEKKDEKRPKTRPAPQGEVIRLDGFPCQLGDVLLRITGEEAWLAGGVIFSEEVPVAALFVAPDAGHDCAIYVRPAPREVVYWLEPLDPTAVLVAGEPPSAVEHEGIRFDRSRRLPLRPKRIGVGAPDVGDAVVVAEYTSAGAERLLVMKATTGVVRAFRGLELETASFEVIPSGESTLGDTP